ncbi:hypothetical protein [Actinoallomurus iriomotensis]|nr:hypothetical protein [Actinoallomurus iriomotensis]
MHGQWNAMRWYGAYNRWCSARSRNRWVCLGVHTITGHGGAGLAAARCGVVLSIPGTSKVARLEENLAAATLRLSDAETDELTAAA